MNKKSIERDREVAQIKARMQELGYNQRSLSMKATGKPDTLRNLFNGKSNSLRGDNYKAVMDILWAPQKTNGAKQTQFTETEIGLMSVIRAVIVVLSNYDIIRQNDLKNVFSYQQKDFRMRAQPGAAAVMDQLIEFLNDSPPVEAALKSHTPLSPGRDQSENG